MISKRNIIILAVAIFATLVAAYANHFHNGFHFDDSHTIVDNVHIRSLKNIPQFFTDARMFSNDPLHWGMRPVVTTTLAIDYWAGGSLDPFYFQLDTFLWFVALCVMLYFIYCRLLENSIQKSWLTFVAILGAGWYALHTANAETINYVISRSDVLSTFFICASFLMYIGLPQYRKYYFYILPAVAGVFAKETVLVLVIILFFYILLFECKLSIADVFRARNFKTLLRAFKAILPLLIAVALAQIYTLSKVPPISGISNPLLPYLITQTYVWLHYFIAFFLPMNLSADTDWTIIPNVFDERVVVGIVFVIALFVTIIKTSKHQNTRPIAFGLIWFSAALLPTSLAPFAEVTNDHRMFFPFIGLALSVVTSTALFLGQNPQVFSKYKPVVFVCIALVLGLNAYGIHQRDKVWKDEETLWLDVTHKSPLNGRGLMNYGLTQMNKGNYVSADSCFEKGLPLLPYYNLLYINLGILKGVTNKPQEAEEYFKKAISLSPNTFDSYVYYARYLTQVGRFADAQPLAEKAYQINPYSALAADVLMVTYNGLGMWDKLGETAARALAILPNDATALAFAKAAKEKVSVTVANIAPKPKTKLTAADYLNMSLAYYNQKEYQKCIDACIEALKLKPDYADAYSNMGAAYNQLQQWEKGAAACNKALQINPNHKLAAGNLAWAKSNLHK